jgi:hypothetical protein
LRQLVKVSPSYKVWIITLTGRGGFSRSNTLTIPPQPPPLDPSRIRPPSAIVPPAIVAHDHTWREIGSLALAAMEMFKVVEV